MSVSVSARILAETAMGLTADDHFWVVDAAEGTGQVPEGTAVGVGVEELRGRVSCGSRLVVFVQYSSTPSRLVRNETYINDRHACLLYGMKL